MNVNYFDMIVLVLFALFILRGVMNGILGEFSGLVGLLGGLWYANYAHKDVVPHLASLVRNPVWRDLAAYGLVFLSVLLAVELLSRVASKALSLTATSALDKGLGALLGLGRGIVVCSVSLVLLRHFLPDAPFFTDSLITPMLAPVMNFAKRYLPAALV
jgi:membrane protein required for colicin V production